MGAGVDGASVVVARGDGARGIKAGVYSPTEIANRLRDAVSAYKAGFARENWERIHIKDDGTAPKLEGYQRSALPTRKDLVILVNSAVEALGWNVEDNQKGIGAVGTFSNAVGYTDPEKGFVRNLKSRLGLQVANSTNSGRPTNPTVGFPELDRLVSALERHAKNLNKTQPNIVAGPTESRPSIAQLDPLPLTPSKATANVIKAITSQPVNYVAQNATEPPQAAGGTDGTTTRTAATTSRGETSELPATRENTGSTVDRVVEVARKVPGGHVIAQGARIARGFGRIFGRPREKSGRQSEKSANPPTDRSNRSASAQNNGGEENKKSETTTGMSSRSSSQTEPGNSTVSTKSGSRKTGPLTTIGRRIKGIFRGRKHDSESTAEGGNTKETNYNTSTAEKIKAVPVKVYDGAIKPAGEKVGHTIAEVGRKTADGLKQVPHGVRVTVSRLPGLDGLDRRGSADRPADARSAPGGQPKPNTEGSAPSSTASDLSAGAPVAGTLPAAAAARSVSSGGSSPTPNPEQANAPSAPITAPVQAIISAGPAVSNPAQPAKTSGTAVVTNEPTTRTRRVASNPTQSALSAFLEGKSVDVQREALRLQKALEGLDPAKYAFRFEPVGGELRFTFVTKGGKNGDTSVSTKFGAHTTAGEIADQANYYKSLAPKTTARN